ncbi:telomerase RNA component interacting RNase [Phyllostomus discolor]|uniref:Telomerase RNA component interacting RNase n=2 Tax=Phyllostomus discolor TaxID=89673 RepID=A0A833ZJ63_9CHIR|nr:telomerase RNA component interacting RNase [Phyllostomus discolor]
MASFPESPCLRNACPSLGCWVRCARFYPLFAPPLRSRPHRGRFGARSLFPACTARDLTSRAPSAGPSNLPEVLCAAPGDKMAARGRRAEPPGREAAGPAAGGGGGSRWAESGPGTSPESGDEEVSSPVSGGVNLFANDGSFLELFKRKMEEEQRQRQEEPPPGPPRPDQPATAAAAGPGDPKRKGGPGPTLSFVGKRRGGNKLALKTGIVAKKQKTEDEVLTSKGDAWAKYMAEVKKYKAHQCGDDDKTRPLVK